MVPSLTADGRMADRRSQAGGLAMFPRAPHRSQFAPAHRPVARALLSASPSVTGRANCRSCPSTAQVRFPPCQGLPVFRRLWVSGKRSQTLNSGGTE